MQADAVGYAYQSWRRQWKGPGKQYVCSKWALSLDSWLISQQTSGAIVWQLNDCWPVTSWAIVDYFVCTYLREGVDQDLTLVTPASTQASLLRDQASNGRCDGRCL